MATVLAHDVGAHCVAQGSSVFYSSLDVEAAFDGLPHCVLLRKSMNIIPRPIWLLLHNWYMYVTTRWSNNYSEKIRVECGTKQGGQTSPMLFNLFYADLVNKLQSSDSGIRIGKNNFNCFCYADDLLLCSLTVTGLQSTLCWTLVLNMSVVMD